MLTMLLYVLIVGLVAALLFLIASAVFGRAEELGPLPEGTTETVLPAEDISGADVRDLRFQQVFRGYKAGEVDWALARLAARIDELEGQLARARDESPRHTPATSVERTGSGTVPGPWTGVVIPVVEQAAASPHPSAEHRGGLVESGEERTVRTERQVSGEARTVRTERHGEPRPGEGNSGTQAGPQAFAPAAASPFNGVGPIPWHGPAETGPWEAPSAGGNGAAHPAQAPEPHTASWTAGLLPGVPSGSPYPAVPEVSRAEQATPAPGAGAEMTGSVELTGSLALPPIAPTPGQPAFGQPPAHPGGPGPWPGTSGQL